MVFEEDIEVREPTKPSIDKEKSLQEAENLTNYLKDVSPPQVIISVDQMKLLLEKEEGIRYDPVTGSYAWVHVSVERQISTVTFLLPLNLPAEAHLRSLSAALEAAGTSHPEALEWEVFAMFRTPGEPNAAHLKALTYQQYFTNDKLGIKAEVISNNDGTESRISLPTLQQAIDVIKEWKLGGK